ADRADAASVRGYVFFDRGLVDAASALQHLTGEDQVSSLSRLHRYHATAFFVPPWPEIYVTDAERRHDFAAAVEEYERLTQAYPAAGYQVRVLPKVGIGARADIVLSTLAGSS